VTGKRRLRMTTLYLNTRKASMSTLSLNCLLLNDDSKHVFTVEIPETKNISILKELIKEKKARHLAHLDASDLILWKVRLPPDQSPS